MPRYNFLCQKCGNRFTEIVPVSEYEKRSRKGFRCPQCMSRRVEQDLGGFAVQTSRKS